MTAVVALLIGLLAVEDGGVPPFPDYPLTPVNDDTPRNRRVGSGPVVDDETVGAMAPSTGIVTIERRIIIRIPTLPRSAPAEVRNFAPKTAVANPTARKGATCLSLRSVRGATLDDRAGILFVTGDSRYQAALERGCRPVDFQSGFYLSPSADGAICAGRDTLHARSGLHCTITGLKRLSPGM